MVRTMDTEFYAQRIQCSRSDKQDLLDVVWQLMELANVRHSFGLLDLDRRLNAEPLKYSDPFLRKAAALIVDYENEERIRTVLYNYILSGNYSGSLFLKSIVITETLLAIKKDLSMDYIFIFLVPSLFGMDCESFILNLYDEFKSSRGSTVHPPLD
ncbi:MAG: hypothetical protein HFG26_09130 [Provencibacterium sp.]|jgi:hypothetical protein|nr:hypothetical protein [Provencibacterium sp.]